MEMPFKLEKKIRQFISFVCLEIKLIDFAFCFTKIHEKKIQLIGKNNKR